MDVRKREKRARHSHLNSSYKDTESAKVLLLNCRSVIFADEENLLVCSEILTYIWLKFLSPFTEALVRGLWLSSLSRDVCEGVEWYFLLCAEDQVKKQKWQILKGLFNALKTSFTGVTVQLKSSHSEGDGWSSAWKKLWQIIYNPVNYLVQITLVL